MYGADKKDWDHFVSLGLTSDLLPVVSNPTAKIAPTSSLKTLGKTPSRYQDGMVFGIAKWTERISTQADVTRWQTNNDYGISVQCRRLRCFDVDIDDVLSDELKDYFLTRFPNAVFRTRSNSKKFLFPFFLEGEYSKQIIHTPQGNIEFLANGQQFIAVGTHPSGVKYELPLTQYPVITEEDFTDVIDELASFYGESVTLSNSKRRPVGDLDVPADDVASYLRENKNFIREVKGRIDLVCPWEDEHSSDSGPTQCSYFIAGTRNYYQGHFKCFHNHNGHIHTDIDFKHALGFYDIEEDEPKESEPASQFNIPKGLIKDTTNWIINTAAYPQPELALLNTIAFAGAVFGRRYRMEKTNFRTNIYVAGIAPTGAGKDHSRKQIKRLAEEATLSMFIGPDSVVSGQGVLTALSKKPSCLMMLDEFGMLLSAMTGTTAQHYMKITAKIFTELYSSSTVLYQGGVYADPKRDPINIHQPNLCIYGTSTLVKYAEALTPDAIDSGEINRYIVIKPEIEYPEPNYDADASFLPDDLVRRWNAFNQSLTIADLTGEPNQIVVKPTCDVTVLYKEQYDIIRKGDPTVSPLYVRYAENILKIAMIFAIADNHNEPLLTSDHIDIGRQIVDKAIKFMQLVIESGIGMSNGKQNRPSDPIYIFIKRAMPTKRELYRKFRSFDTNEVDRSLDNLLKQGYITLEKSIENKGRPREFYKVTPVKR